MKRFLSNAAKLAGLLAALALVGAPVAAYAGLPIATAPILGAVIIALLGT